MAARQEHSLSTSYLILIIIRFLSPPKEARVDSRFFGVQLVVSQVFKGSLLLHLVVNSLLVEALSLSESFHFLLPFKLKELPSLFRFLLLTLPFFQFCPQLEPLLILLSLVPLLQLNRLLILPHAHHFVELVLETFLLLVESLSF